LKESKDNKWDRKGVQGNKEENKSYECIYEQAKL